MKKLLLLILSLVMVSSLSTTVIAAENQDNETSQLTFTVNEYDVYVNARASAARNSSSDSTSITSNTIENELTRLSNLTYDELYNLGFDEQRIALLKGYNGERIETNPALRGIFADMTVTFSKVSSSTSSQKIKAFWRWSNPPALAGTEIVDIIGVRWKGTNSAGQPLNVKLDSQNTSYKVEYWTRNNSQLVSTVTRNVSCDDPYGNAYARHNMAISVDDSNYARQGTITIEVDKSGTDAIKEVAYCFAYAHTVINGTPSITFPAAFTINFSSGSQKMVEKAIIMNSSGTITEY